MTNALSKYREYSPENILSSESYPFQLEITQLESPHTTRYTPPVEDTSDRSEEYHHIDLYPMIVYSTKGHIVTISEDEYSD